MTKPKPPTPPPAAAIILYGLGADGRPRAGTFSAEHAPLAEKAALSLKLNVLKIQNDKQRELAKELPPCQIHATDDDVAPPISKALYDKLLLAASTNDAAVPNSPAEPAVKTAQVDSASSKKADSPTPATGIGVAPSTAAVATPKRAPTTWKDIEVGHLVLAEDWEPNNGWYEAVVIERLADDRLKLRFRDYPEEGERILRRDQLALLPLPN